MVFDYENLLVIWVLFDLKLKGFQIWKRYQRDFLVCSWKMSNEVLPAFKTARNVT